MYKKFSFTALKENWSLKFTEILKNVILHMFHMTLLFQNTVYFRYLKRKKIITII